MSEGGKLRKTAAGSLAHLVAQGLRERVPHFFMMEEYGRDGEIMEAWEGHRIEPGEEGAHAVLITGTEYAEPRTDWRERGAVPPRGYHLSHWRK